MAAEREYDYLVIGSGIAGLTFALDAARNGSVLIITKKSRAESNTNYAQGGIAAVLSPGDSFDLHINDTLNAGVGLCHREAVEALVREGPDRVRELIGRGVEFTRDAGRLDLGLEGGHSARRIVHAHDRSGSEIERALLHAVSAEGNITVLEHHLAVELITQHHEKGGRKPGENIRCSGAYVLDAERAKVRKFLSSFTVICSGGLGQVYLHTTNPTIATGDGVAMAYRAGASVANMEFIQFHPTSLYNSGSPAFLISEAIRGFGGILRSVRGEEFMTRHDPRGHLAPRDIVARGIDAELKKTGTEFVHLDLTHLGADAVRSNFPHIHETCLTKFKLDITREPIPVVPAAHYSCGGIVTDLRGRTTIDNLYALGEVAMTGVHGANRLASNSLLEALVFAQRAIRDTAGRLPGRSGPMPEVPEWDDSGTFDPEEWVLIEHNRKEIQQTMWDYVGIIRSTLRLERALRRLNLVRDEIEAFYRRTRVVEGLIELRNLATVADLIVKSALMRKESRGLHYVTDYPAMSDAWKHDTVLPAF
ncbi:MAG TPA: L-aspartate oxidase [Bacteroidota bacterium]|nr:L-aspartate oxidase [Bacteroidota bacterium]